MHLTYDTVHEHLCTLMNNHTLASKKGCIIHGDIPCALSAAHSSARHRVKATTYFMSRTFHCYTSYAGCHHHYHTFAFSVAYGIKYMESTDDSEPILIIAAKRAIVNDDARNFGSNARHNRYTDVPFKSRIYMMMIAHENMTRYANNMDAIPCFLHQWSILHMVLDHVLLSLTRINE